MVTISLETMKRLISDELKAHYKAACTVLNSAYCPEVQKEFLHNAHYDTQERLKRVTDMDELDDFLSYAGYGMSQQEWIDSLK